MIENMSHCANESIYNLIPKECAKEEKKPMHKSKFRRHVRFEHKKCKAAYKTLGVPKIPVRPPDLFLKKHEKAPKFPEKRPFKYPDDGYVKPQVPKPDEKPMMGVKTTKNFISVNALQNIMSVPRIPQPLTVDTRKGDKFYYPSSGFDPYYVNKKDFGRNPSYLARRKADLLKMNDEYDAYVADHFRKGAMKRLSEEDRDTMIEGLKHNWEELHREYICLPVNIDTLCGKMNKERLEVTLAQLEKDLFLLETHREIYIAN